ncbi:MAG: phosphatase PAP2 family protein [Burkholderiales bacterium]|nr:phosphatase PAP2 family protein [Burkholderiales bacterium]
MSPLDIGINLVLSVVLIVGAYQFYFFTQRHWIRPPRRFVSPIDERIPYMPGWSWVYSFLYYPAILYLNLIAGSPGHFLRMAFSFIVLLAMQLACFTLYPVATPAHWRREPDSGARSERFLKFVRNFDAESNCFPSMHVSVATLTALHAQTTLGPVAFAFPLLIAVSCALTKQHYLIDLPFGALLGWGAYRLYLQI